MIISPCPCSPTWWRAAGWHWLHHYQPSSCCRQTWGLGMQFAIMTMMQLAPLLPAWPWSVIRLLPLVDQLITASQGLLPNMYLSATVWSDIMRHLTWKLILWKAFLLRSCRQNVTNGTLKLDNHLIGCIIHSVMMNIKLPWDVGREWRCTKDSVGEGHPSGLLVQVKTGLNPVNYTFKEF